MLGACDLAVENRTSPDTSKVLATPADVEALLGGQFLRHNSSLYGSTANVWGMMNVMSHENFSSLSNNCQGQRVGIPRAGNDNAVGNGCATEQRRVYYIDGEVVRVSSNILAKLDTAGFTLGSTAQDQRARAFANFTRGVSLGYLAMVYDSAAIITPETSTEDPGVLSGYADVMAASLASLDAAIAAAQAPGTGADGFPIPERVVCQHQRRHHGGGVHQGRPQLQGPVPGRRGADPGRAGGGQLGGGHCRCPERDHAGHEPAHRDHGRHAEQQLGGHVVRLHDLAPDGAVHRRHGRCVGQL